MMHGAAIDSKRFRSVMGSFPTGVAVIGIECDGELFGATINSLTFVSLAPCMLLFCTNEASATGAAPGKQCLVRVRSFLLIFKHLAGLSIDCHLSRDRAAPDVE